MPIRFGNRALATEIEHDHWHRSGDDEGRPYAFTTADQLLADFETEVDRVLLERGVGNAVIGDSDAIRRGS
jgi:hypothetical protein